MNINNQNIEEYLLLLLDNELTAEEREAVLLFIEDKEEYKTLLQQFSTAILEIDNTLVFEDKESLLKQERKIIPFINKRAVTGFAAAIALLIGINFITRLSIVEKSNIKDLTTAAIDNNPLPDTNKPAASQKFAVNAADKTPVTAPTPKRTISTKTNEKIQTPTEETADPVTARKNIEAPEYLAMADIKEMEAPEKEIPGHYYAAIINEPVPAESGKWQFIDDENLIGVRDLIAQMNQLKENIQLKTRELKNFSVAIRIGNKDVNLIN